MKSLSLFVLCAALLSSSASASGHISYDCFRIHYKNPLVQKTKNITQLYRLLKNEHRFARLEVIIPEMGNPYEVAVKVLVKYEVVGFHSGLYKGILNDHQLKFDFGPRNASILWMGDGETPEQGGFLNLRDDYDYVKVCRANQTS
jgi:hypothetical protein